MPLTIRHPATTSQLGLRHAIDEVAMSPDRRVKLGRVVLAVLEADEAIQYQRLRDRSARSRCGMPQEAMASQARRQSHHRARRYAELARHLAHPGTTQEPSKHHRQQVRSPQ